MKKMQLIVGALSAIAIVWAPTAMSEPKHGYLVDSFGRVAVDGFGECVKDGNRVKAYEQCEPIVKAEAPPPEPKVVRERATLGADAHFDFDKYNLKPEGKEALNGLLRKLDGVKIERVDVVGHTDSIGTEAYNQALSERRAGAVKSFLVERGISPSLINASGMGESQPIATNATREGRAMNRRVEVSVEGKK